MSVAVQISKLQRRYGDFLALDGIDFSVNAGEMFGLVGPNGGGKSTTFKILATALKPTQGAVTIFDKDVLRSPHLVRKDLGVVFQSPGLDKKLTVTENLIHQGHLYGLKGNALKDKIKGLLAKLGISDRASHLVESLSGGLQRRVEIAKALLHRPKLLILDEPTTGLDPLVRREIWDYLQALRQSENLTILLTTHYVEEADGCDRIALVHRGSIVALGSPEELKRSVGGDVITLATDNQLELKKKIESRFSVGVMEVGRHLRIESEKGHRLVAPLMEAYADLIQSLTLGKPTLEDLFIRKTGNRFTETVPLEDAS